MATAAPCAMLAPDMSAKRPSSPVRLRGTNRVRKDLADGRSTISWYKGRGKGASLLARFEGASYAEALKAEQAGLDQLVAAYHTPKAPPDEPATVKDLVTLFRAAPDGNLKLREGSTRAKWAPWLDKIVAEFGSLPIVALKAKGVRSDVIKWRNRWADKPRTADYAIQVLQRVFSWAMENELAEANPAAGIKGLYKSNRASIVVEEHELEAIAAAVPTEAGRLLIRLAAATGLRRGDLIDLQWHEVGEFSIERAADKSIDGRRVLVPLIAEARAALAELRKLNKARKVPSTYVCVSRKGPWHKDGVGTTWNRAVKKALGDEADRHFHDLRGTACTRFCKVPLTDEEVADIMGWEPEQVRQIRKRYVDREKIARGIVERLEKAEKGT